MNAVPAVDRVDYTAFVKRVVEPADGLRRVFVELLIRDVDSEILSKIRDVKIREALEILLDRQKRLVEALEQYHKALTVAENADAIVRVRRAIESLSESSPAGKKVFDIVREALASLSIVSRTDREFKLEDVIDDISKGLARLSSTLYSLASRLGVHASEYRPRPEKAEVELVLYIAIVLLNYLTDLLLRYGTQG